MFIKKKIYKRDAPFKAVFKVKALAVLFPPYPREMRTSARNLNLLPFCRLFVSMEMVQPIPTRTRVWPKHVHSFDRCGHTLYTTKATLAFVTMSHKL